VTPTAIALKKMIHFRILIPSRKSRGYERRLKNTRQNRPQSSGGRLGCVALRLSIRKSKRQMLQFRDNAAVVIKTPGPNILDQWYLELQNENVPPSWLRYDDG
jgi:hypothetical protein